MITIEETKRFNCIGERDITNWLKNIPYESSVVVWNSEINREESAFYFGYNPQRDFHLFLREEKGKLLVYTIEDDKCWVKHWDSETYIPCLDTKKISSLEKFWGGKEEVKYALKRLKKLKIK